MSEAKSEGTGAQAVRMPVASQTMSQRSRAGLDVLGGILKFTSVATREAARQDFETSPEGRALTEAHATGTADTPEAIAERVDKAKDLAASLPNYRMERFAQRYVAEEMMNRNLVAAEEMRAMHEHLDSLPVNSAGGSLALDPEAPLPDWYEGIHFHLAPIGVDGYDLGTKGAGIGRVFRYGGFAAVPPGSNIGGQRIDVVQQFRRRDHTRILEIGCGSVFTLLAISKVFPEAELIGCDLNGRGLKEGHRLAEKMGLKVDLRQCDARTTGEADGSVDAVFSYAVHHEAPVPVNREMFAEAFRILKSGGEIVISDPPPFRAVDMFTAVLLEWDNDHREEPYFRETCLANWEDELRAAGFVEVEAYGLGAQSYPWVTRAVKP
ncbi:class I SAM-dependent methyltransferase [Novosphingobium sp. MBES04]|uniref:class I SAM-dependent methyltransferase n=1 Tax=Novosphingobium sp. MBES04 TaxID=1206458 RepID=UPI0006932EA2|nr:class I SAM-dependent methyltransferase [Novosphingobium sp. MBES04]GAM05188.1 type 11 methyltransferase [Novosphingobium sp. MBES04]